MFLNKCPTKMYLAAGKKKKEKEKKAIGFALNHDDVERNVLGCRLTY